MINKSIFRMYDVRGIAEKDLDNDTVYKIGKAFATYIKRRNGKTVVAGMDVRKSGPRIKENFIKGVLETGINVIDVGIVTTPMLYFSMHYFNTDGGIMVTGSHNPIEYNGLKMVDPDVTIYGEVIQSFYTIIENNDFEEGKGNYEEKPIKDEYINTCVSKIKINKKLKIVVDPGNGTAGPIAKALFEKLGIEAKFINYEPDGNFPNHLPDPTVLKYIKELRELVRNGDYDAGIGYDGDADRIGLIDENGEVVFGDQILGILAGDVIKRHKGEKVVFDVKCSQGLEEYIKSLGGVPIMYKTGHSLLKRKMKEENALIAGEMSGHMFFKENYYGFDDGIFASLLILQILSNSDKTLSEIKSEMPYYYSTPEIRVNSTDEDKFNIVKDITDYYKSKGNRVIDIDGCRVYFDNGWALVRASNTQPILVVRIEAKTEEDLEKIKKEIKVKLEEYNIKSDEL